MKCRVSTYKTNTELSASGQVNTYYNLTKCVEWKFSIETTNKQYVKNGAIHADYSFQNILRRA